VSDQTLAIAAEEGFRWFGTDEGVLGRTLNLGFFRDGSGLPANAERLYRPWNFPAAGQTITGFFRDHHLSDLIAFVYSRMDSKAAAADLHGGCVSWESAFPRRARSRFACFWTEKTPGNIT